VYQVDRGWSLHKDINCKELRWTVTDTAISPDQKFLVSGALENMIGPPVALLATDLGQACPSIEMPWKDSQNVLREWALYGTLELVVYIPSIS
jgi:hypothetical protein